MKIALMYWTKLLAVLLRVDRTAPAKKNLQHQIISWANARRYN
jgi:hypothetical protein